MIPSNPRKRPKPVWESEAQRQLALWRQRSGEAKTAVNAHFLVEAAKKHGISLESLKQ